MRHCFLLLASITIAGCKSTDACQIASDPCITCPTTQACPPAAPQATPQVEVQQPKEIHVQAKQQKVYVKRNPAEGEPQSEMMQLQRAAAQAQNRVMLVPTQTLTPYVVARANQIGPIIMQGEQADQLIAQSGQRVVRRQGSAQAVLQDDTEDNGFAQLQRAQQPSPNELIGTLKEFHSAIVQQTKALEMLQKITEKQEGQINELNTWKANQKDSKVRESVPTNPNQGNALPSQSMQQPVNFTLPAAQPEKIPMPSPVLVPVPGK